MLARLLVGLLHLQGNSHRFFHTDGKLPFNLLLCDIPFSEYTTIFNIGFVIYTGESIDRYHKGNFAKEIAFVKGLSKAFNIDNNDTNAGIITYSGEAEVKYRLPDISNQTDLENALDTLRINGTGRNIGKALDLARTDLFNQSTTGRNFNVRNILVVVTDGPSDDDLAVPTYALKDDNVTVFSVGIDRYVRGQLNEMASDPDSEHVFTIDSYRRLGRSMPPLKDAIIRGMYRTYKRLVKLLVGVNLLSIKLGRSRLLLNLN